MTILKEKQLKYDKLIKFPVVKHPLYGFPCKHFLANTDNVYDKLPGKSRTPGYAPRTKIASQVPFLVLQLVTNGRLVSASGETNQYLKGPQQEYWSPSGQISHLCQYLEGPISTWKDNNRNIGVQKNADILIVVLIIPSSGLKYSYCDPSRYWLVLLGTEKSPLFETS